MPGSFYPLTSFRTVKVLDASTILDVQLVTCVTIPTGITFQYGVPYAGWKGGTGPGIGLLDDIATQIETMVTDLHVTAGTASQDFDKNNLLIDEVELVVELDRSGVGLPSLTETVTIPIDLFVTTDTGIGGLVIPPVGGLTPNEIVQAAYQRLVQLNGG